jgi:RNA polymerase sigma factor (TIGR02999 family)
MPLVHGELRRIARGCLRQERPNHTLQATALVNEAFLRLVDVNQISWRDRAHFLAMAARLMRRILVDFARTRHAAKRGGDAVRVSLVEARGIAARPGHDLVALDEALSALAVRDARKARVVELRFFAGLSVEETALVLEVSRDTVLRDWRLARAWLTRELLQPGAGPV